MTCPGFPLWLAVSSLLSAVAAVGADVEGPTVLTVGDLFEQRITRYIGKEFVLRTGLKWEYASVKIPEDPTPQKELERQAGPLRVPLEGPQFKDLKSAKHMRVVGDRLKKVAGKDGKQIYSIDGTEFEKDGAKYDLKVRLTLREHFNPKMLKNPAFVKQCNDPRYWSQTFHLEILGLQESVEPNKPDDASGH